MTGPAKFSDNRWICVQLGAREHYAVPRALNRVGKLEKLITDCWTSGPLRMLPGGFGNKIRTRCHPDLDTQQIVSFNARSMGFELVHRDPLSWETILLRNRWFRKLAAEHLELFLPKLLHQTTNVTVFSYSYTSKEVFEVAKRFGCNTVLGQIDPGIGEWKLVEELHRQRDFPAPVAPPNEYWDDWRAECELADTIVVNSEWSKSLLVENGIDGTKTKIVPLALESKASPAKKCDELVAVEYFTKTRPLRVLFLGQLILRKGATELIEAIRCMPQDNIYWTIVGNGQQELIRQLSQLPNVSFEGRVTRDRVGQFYSESDVFILPTHSDGFALTQLEALAHGVPVIASRNCGDVVQHGVNGWLLDDVSCTSICNTVQELLDSPSCVNHCRRNIASNLNTEAWSLNSLSQRLSDLANQQFEISNC